MFDRLLSALKDRLTGQIRQPRERSAVPDDKHLLPPLQPQTRDHLRWAAKYWLSEWQPGGPKRWSSITPTLAALWRAILILTEEAERQRRD